MQISDTGSHLEPKHIHRIHNALWYEFRTVSQTRDGIQRTLEFNKKHGDNSATKPLQKCISDLDLEVYELEYLLNYTEHVIEKMDKETTKEVTK